MADFNSSSAAVCPQVFYLFTMVVLTIVVASVLEAFRFRIQYKRSTTKRDGEHPPALAPCPSEQCNERTRCGVGRPHCALPYLQEFGLFSRLFRL